jgi:K+-transporting ATPase KdpF subunit
MALDIATILALAASIALAGYLFYVLARPERF